MRRQVQEKGPLNRLARARSLLRHVRGQAMVEYSIVSHVLMLGGAATIWYFSGYLYSALDLYYQSIYFVLQSSVP